MPLVHIDQNQLAAAVGYVELGEIDPDEGD